MQIYLFTDPDSRYFKIGISNNVMRRLKDFSLPFVPQLLVAIKVEDRETAALVEGELHRHFADKHLNLEWFRDVDPEDFIQRSIELLKEAGLGIGDYKILSLVKRGETEDSRLLKILREQGLDAAREASKKSTKQYLSTVPDAPRHGRSLRTV